jgi:hemolysin activation/secretion protein
MSHVKKISFLLALNFMACASLGADVGSPDIICKGIIIRGAESRIATHLGQGVLFDNIEVPASEELFEKELSPYLGTTITSSMLKEIQGSIQNFYTDNNLPLIQVIVPQQDITDGMVQIQVLESKVGKVRVEGGGHSSEKQLKNYLGLKHNDQINVDTMRNRLDFMNRNPFRKVNLVYAPGDDTLTTDIELLVDDRRPFRFYAGANNEGVPTTGREQLVAGFNCARMFSLDHFFAYQYTSTDNFHNFQGHTVQYLAFLPWRNVLSMYGGYSSVHADLPFPSQKNHGYSFQASGRYIVPFGGTKVLSHEASVGFDFKRTNNTVVDSESNPIIAKNVNLGQFMARYAGTVAKESYELGYEAELFVSPGAMMTDQTKEDYESLRPHAKNHWVYGRVMAKYLQRLPASFMFSCIGRGQLASENLLPSEQVGLGGFNSVRGYDERQLNYDSGAIINTELQSPGIPVISFFKKKKAWRDAIQLIGFIDYGYGTNHNLLPGEAIHNYLLGVGPGLRYTLDPWLTARLDLGVKLHKDATFSGGEAMWYFSTVGSF